MPSLEYPLDKIAEVAEMVLSEIQPSPLCFYGEMGAGKTTLIKAILQQLDAVDLGNSPTFGLVNEYHNNQGELLAYHFDFYRINSLEEAMDIGLEEYFTRGVYVFMEWPEKIEELLPDEYHKISVYFVDKNTRRIEY